MHLMYDNEKHMPYVFNVNNFNRDYVSSWALMGYNYRCHLTGEVYPYYYVGILRWGNESFIKFLFAQEYDDDIFRLIILKELDSYLE